MYTMSVSSIHVTMSLGGYIGSARDYALRGTRGVAAAAGAAFAVRVRPAGIGPISKPHR